MNDLKFCPKCGSEKLQWLDNIKWHCDNCDFVLYHNCAAAVAVVISHKDEIFFTIRNQNPGFGKLDLPGGFSDPNESLEETCSRELKEELGISIKPNSFKYLGSLPNIYPYKTLIYNTLDSFFWYEAPNKFEMNLEETEISSGIWINKNKIDYSEIAFESQKKFLKEYLK